MDNFLTLKQVLQLVPDTPGLLPLLQEAARLCSTEGKCSTQVLTKPGPLVPAFFSPVVTNVGALQLETRWWASKVGYSMRQAHGPAVSALGVLGLGAGCSEAAVRSAYRRLAIKWHPDKWMKASAEAQAAAAETFRAVQAALESLQS